MSNSEVDGAPERDDVAKALARIEARLDRLESALEPAASLAREALLALATLTDVVDEKAARIGDVEARLNALVDLSLRLSRAETLAKLTTLVDLAEDAPAMIATLGDTFDELMDEGSRAGLDLSRLVTDGKGLLFGLMKLATAPEFHAMLHPDTIRSLGDLARVLSEARKRPPPRVGLFGTLRAMRDEDVQRAVGFLLEVASGLGRVLDREASRAREKLPARGERHDGKERP